MAQVGRISGPLLSSNLERQGRNLKFRNTLDTTPVLWLDVNTGKIGINYNGEPLSELYIPNTAQFQNLIGVNTARFDNWSIGPNFIGIDSGSIYLDSQSTINLTGLGTDQLIAQNNFIKTYNSNTNLELNPSGTGTVEVQTNTWVDGSIHATGNITADGNLVLGSGDEDNIIINAELTVPLTPAQDNTYSLGTADKTFGQIYSPLLNGELLTVQSIAIGALSDLGRKIGNTFYVAVGGDDNNEGDHPQGPFRTIKRALDAADGSTAGPVTIHIFPGTYEEALPLTVPPNTTVSGEDIRNVIVKPAAGYERNDVFLLNGETTIQNLTIKKDPPNFVLDNPNAYNTSAGDYFGYRVAISESYAIVGAWREDDAGGADSGKAYIYDNSTGALLHTLDNPNAYDTSAGDRFGYSVAITESYAIVGALFEDDAGGTDSGKAYVYPFVFDTIAAFRFAPNAIVSTRSPYIQNCSVIFNHTPALNSLQENYYQNVKGALVDGADVDPNSNEASMLFHSCTFITPYSDALVATNGARVEWLNSFTYFANRGIYAYNGTTGHLSSDGSTIKYGAEIRSIGSACVYGNYGIVGDGNEVIVYAINHNLAYIGAGTDVTNDSTLAIVDNEIVKSNNAQVYYQSTDHTGDYRVGENFLVDFGTGLTDFVFGTGIVDFSGEVDPETGEIEDYNSITIENTIINPARITIGDFRISGNTIETLNQEFTINPQGTANIINFLADTQIPLTLTSENLYLNGDFVYNGTDHTILQDATADYVPATTGTYDLGKNNYRWNNLYVSGIDISDIMIRDTYISTNSLNTDLSLQSLAKKIKVNDTDVILSQNLAVTGITTLPETITANLTGNGSIVINENYSTAKDFNTQRLDVRSQFYTEDIIVEDNFITTSLSNSNLELRTSGVGKVIFENIKIDNDFNLDQLFVNETYFNVLRSDLDVGNIKIYQNVIETTESNSDLEFKGYQDRGVYVETVSITNSTISTTSGNLTLETPLLDISTAEKSLVLPQGNTAQRNNLLGSLRYNTQTGLFEGYNNGYQNFGGLISEDGRTKIVISADNEVSFFANNQFLGTLDTSLLSIHAVSVDDTIINGNTILTNASNADLELIANGTGNIFLNDFEIDDNKFIQTNINDRTIFSSTGTGYYSFGGTIGVQIPYGTSSERGVGILGQLRWNTQESLLEIFDGSNWIDAEGFVEEVSQDVDDLLNFEASLILG